MSEPAGKAVERPAEASQFTEISVTLGLGRDKRRLETAKDDGSLKGVFKGQGFWGLPQQL